MSTNSVRGGELRVWDLPLRLFHWLLAAAVAVAFASAFESSPLAPWHQAAGWVAGVLIVFRLVWGVVGGEHARFADFCRFDRIGRHVGALLRGQSEPSLGHNPLGGLAVLGLIGLTAITVVTGVLVIRGGEDDLHEAVAYALLSLVGLHLVAVVAMSRLGGENLVAAMVTGRKRAARHPGGADARPPSLATLLLAALALAGAVYVAVVIDPDAFGPHRDGAHGEELERGHGAPAGVGAPSRHADRD